MGRNFDDDRLDDLSFIIGGERFTMEYQPPEVLAEYEDARAENLMRIREEAKAAEAAGEEYIIENDAQQTILDHDRRIKSMLSSADHERWDELRSRKAPHAVPYMQIKELERWMVEVQTVRPTVTPSPSGAGRGSTGRLSTVKPRSQEAVPAA